MNYVSFVTSLGTAPLIQSLSPSLAQIVSLNRAVSEIHTLKRRILKGEKVLPYVRGMFESLGQVRGETVLPPEELEEIEKNFSRNPSSIREIVPKIEEEASRLESRLAQLYAVFGRNLEYLAKEYVLSMLSMIVGREKPTLTPTAFKMAPISELEKPDWAREISWKWLSREVSGNEYPAYLDEEGKLTIGRGERVNLVIDSMLVSHRHAVISYRKGRQYWIQDAGSQTGTRLNGGPLPLGMELPLKTGDEISFGPERIKILLPLERLSPGIVLCVSFTKLISLLLENGEDRYADLIARLPNDPSLWKEVPEEGGLREKAEELLILKDFDDLHESILPGLGAEASFALLGLLAGAVQAAEQIDDLVRMLRRHFVPAGFLYARQVRDFARGRRPLQTVTNACSVKSRLRTIAEARLVRPPDRELLKELGLEAVHLVEQPWRRIEIAQFPELSKNLDRVKETILKMTGSQEQSSFPREALELSEEDLGEIIDGYLEEGAIAAGELTPAKPFQGRILFTLEKDAAGHFWEFLVKEASPVMERQSPIQVRMNLTSASLLFHIDAQQMIFRLLEAYFHRYPKYFRGDFPLFTLPLRDSDRNEMTGVSFRQEPALHPSCLKKTLRFLEMMERRGTPLTWSLFHQAAALFMDQAGIDLTHPSLLKGALQRFSRLVEPY